MSDDIDRIEFFVPGIPMTAGSKKAFTNPKTGKAIIADDTGQAGKLWRGDVKQFALQVHGVNPPLEGALLLTVEFVLPRPAGHSGSGRNSGKLRDSAPPFPTVKPDVTKMLRAVEDALTGLLWKDDAQIVRQIAAKYYRSEYYPRIGVRVVVLRVDK